MGRITGRKVAALVVVVAWLVVLSACGDPDADRADGRTDAAEDAAAPSERSSPFVVDTIPDGFVLARAGAGTFVQSWGDDTGGTDEPFTVLAPDDAGGDGAVDIDRPGADQLVVVSVTGFEGNQGGLAQASPAYMDEAHTTTEVDGHRALFAPLAGSASTGPPRTWTDLLVEVGADLAVRVTAEGDRPLDELARFVRATTPDADHAKAPRVDPPEGWKVAGSADAAVTATQVDGAPVVGSDLIPGPSSAHSALWARGRDELAVMTVPGDELDLVALHALPRFSWGTRAPSTVRVGDRSGIAVVEHSSCGLPDCDDGTESGRRAVYLPTGWGDVVVASAAGPSSLDVDELAAVAASVTRADAASWDRFVAASGSGPGLHLDPGAVEITRGSKGGVEWLLQALPPDGDRSPTIASSGSGAAAGGGPTANRADRCLRLSTGRRVCATSSGSGLSWNVSASEPSPGSTAGAPDLPGFVIVGIVDPAATGVRVRSADGEVADAPLVDVPGSEGWRVAVVFVDRPGIPGCLPVDTTAPPGGTATMRVDLLDASGASLGCLGFGGRT